MSFKDLGVNPALTKVLHAGGIEKPFPIQKATLPDAIAGKDILGRGQTGSGKTLAFGLALMTRLAGRTAASMRPLALVLSPTRELAMQISDVIAPLSRTVNLNSQVVAGGLSYSKQIQARKRGVPIVVATPGRVIDLIQKKHIRLDDIEITVLDEADQMADMGFLPDVKRILDLTKPGGQRMLFSATLDKDVDSLVKKYLKNPVTHSLADEKSTAGNMTHHVLIMEQSHKDLITSQIASRKGKSIFFVRTKHGADKVVKILHKENITAAAIHGNKSQNARQNALSSFKNGNLRVLVATDIAARGIDIDELSHVINFELPNVPETYVHRIGRTGRAGNTGIAFSFCDHDERTELKDIQKLIGKNIPVVDSHPYPLSAASFASPASSPHKPPFKKSGNNFNSSDRGRRRGPGPQKSNNR